jgi:hypothetical protein
MVALSTVVWGLDAELRRLGYEDSGVVWYLGRWRRLRARENYAQRSIPGAALTRPNGPSQRITQRCSLGWQVIPACRQPMWRTLMTAPFVWFDLTADGGAAREFYAGLFGWPIGPARR